MVVLSSQNKNLLKIKYKIKFLLGIKNIFKLKKNERKCPNLNKDSTTEHKYN